MIKLSTITINDIDARGKLTHEPRWMRQARMKAWQDFQALEYPNWKKTKTPSIDLEKQLKLEFPSGETKPIRIEKKPPAGSSGKITLKDGRVWRVSLKPELAYQGVIFCDMQTAVLERADLLEQYFKDSSWGIHDKLTALHKALWTNGYFLFIPKDLQVDEPFQVQVIQSRFSICDRNLVILEPGSSVRLEEVFESDQKSNEVLVCANTTQIISEEASRLDYRSTQNWGAHVADLSYRRMMAAQNAHIKSLFTLLGAKSGRTVVTGLSAAPGASIEHNGILGGGDQQRFKIIAEMEHSGKNTEGMMKYKGILKDKSYSYLDGCIRVGQDASKAHSRLEEHTLLLSEKARCDALPALDIKTDDVQVSHSASVRKADREKIFYLMSRGLSEELATNLLVQGFFEDLLEKAPSQSWYESTKALIESKLFETKI
ncbi:MAG: SufD family Fe-S cluster assembly protein [bacterium]|nr:SufD family Fe-S cluster assembly protein [bacterium]